MDTAPVIYFAEKHPRYYPLLKPLFEMFDAGETTAVSSPITLAECLVWPLGLEDMRSTGLFVDLLAGNQGCLFAPITKNTAIGAASIRFRYNIPLPDAIQVSAAIETECTTLLTNDKALSRVRDVQILLVEDLIH